MPSADPRADRHVVLVTATPRSAPGLLTWEAWRVLRSGLPVSVLRLAPAWAVALQDAGVVVVEEPEPRPEGVWFDAAGDQDLAATLATSTVTAGVRLEVVMGSYELPGARVLDLVATMDRLRSPGGCPWDARQSHQSLLRYLVEETYEVIEAVETGDRGHLEEELGDLLLQVVFHSRIAEEHPISPFTLDDVAAGIVRKLVHRHPHVFSEESAPTVAHVEEVWERQKAAEKGRLSALDGIPAGLPALARAEKALDRVERHGVAVELPSEDDVGSRLLRDVADARRGGVSAEDALRQALRAWERRVRELERGGAAASSGESHEAADRRA